VVHPLRDHEAVETGEVGVGQLREVDGAAGEVAGVLRRGDRPVVRCRAAVDRGQPAALQRREGLRGGGPPGRGSGPDPGLGAQPVQQLVRNPLRRAARTARVPEQVAARLHEDRAARRHPVDVGRGLPAAEPHEDLGAVGHRVLAAREEPGHAAPERQVVGLDAGEHGVLGDLRDAVPAQ